MVVNHHFPLHTTTVQVLDSGSCKVYCKVTVKLLESYCKVTVKLLESYCKINLAQLIGQSFFSFFPFLLGGGGGGVVLHCL